MHTPLTKTPLGRRVTGTVLATLVAAGAGCAASDADADDPVHIVVQSWAAPDQGSRDDLLTDGLVREVTHWLTYSPRVVVRAPLTGRIEDAGDVAPLASGLAVGHVLRIAVHDVGSPTLHWALTRVPEGTIVADGSTRIELDALPDVAPSVVAFVLEELTPGAVGGIRPAEPTIDAEAYAAFVRILGEPDTAFDRVAALTRRAERLEALRGSLSNYAPAVVELGTAHLDLAGLIGGQGGAYERAEEALRRAHGLDPAYPPGREKLAAFDAKLGRSEDAVRLLAEGLETHPSFPEFHGRLGYVYRYGGHMDASIVAYRTAQALDASLPNRVATQDQITKSLIYQGDYTSALISHQRMQSFLDGMRRRADEKQWFYEGVIHLYNGDAQSALAAFASGEVVDAESVWTTFGHGYRAVALRDTATVLSVLEGLEAREVVDGERRYRLVHLAVGAGQPERALDHLEASIRGGFFNAPYIASDPLTAPLHELPRFQALLAEARERHDAMAPLIAPGHRPTGS